MNIAGFIFLMLFVIFNIFVGASLLLKALAGFLGTLRPAQKMIKSARAGTKRRAAWTASVWHNQRSLTSLRRV